MRLQDLKDDLAHFDGDCSTCRHYVPNECVAVARRVANLYQNCPECGGTGERPGLGALMWKCGLCDGYGTAALDGPLRWPATALARCLLGEE